MSAAHACDCGIFFDLSKFQQVPVEKVVEREVVREVPVVSDCVLWNTSVEPCSLFGVCRPSERLISGGFFLLTKP